MTLSTYLRIFRERWRLVALTTLIGVALSVLITALTPKSYQATAQLFVSANGQETAQTAQTGQFDLQAAVQAQMSTFAELVDSQDVLNMVRHDLNLTLSNAQLRAKITATAPASQTLLVVTATDGSPAAAAAIANSAANALAVEIKHLKTPVKLNGKPTGDPSTVRLKVTQQASAPSSPVSPRPVLNIVLGFVLGLLLAVVLAVARDTLDNRVKTVEELAKIAGAPAMGTVAEDPTADRYPVAAHAGRQNVRAENFRQLRANLQFANVDEHPRILAVTSSIPSEGKTMVAINLATTLAEAGFTVCLIDADLRRPTVASSLGLASPVGLTSVLISQIDMSEALQSAGPNLSVLTSGPTPPNPSEVLASSYVRDVVRGLLDRVDYVVLDTAPLLPVADGAEVAALADGTLLVARYKITTEAQLKRATLMLRRVDARLIGVLLNGVPITRRGEYGYSYYGYAGGSEELVAGKNGRSHGLGLRKRQETSGV